MGSEYNLNLKLKTKTEIVVEVRRLFTKIGNIKKLFSEQNCKRKLQFDMSGLLASHYWLSGNVKNIVYCESICSLTAYYRPNLMFSHTQQVALVQQQLVHQQLVHQLHQIR